MVFSYLWTMIWGPSAIEVRLEQAAKEATTYEEWKICQRELDELRGVNQWASQKQTKWYKWQALEDFKNGIRERRLQGNLRVLGNYLRRIKRSMANMTDPVLYRHSHIQTKALIHEYVKEVRKGIAQITNTNMPSRSNHTISNPEKCRLIRDLHKIMGQTTLVLQGGAGASMCHLGVVKALYKRELLPKIITGSGTGSLIAALACTTPDKKLLERLTGEAMDLSAFERARERSQKERAQANRHTVWVSTWLRRLRRFFRTGHLFDISIIEQCARDNLGDMTFDEAHDLTGRILNITTPMSIVRGTPQLLNYITAPHVVIWSAVAASVATSKTMYTPARVYIKEDSGKISNYFAADYTTRQKEHMWQASLAPLGRIGEQFNVNHFIFSQTRPYIAPFIQLQQDLYRQNWLLGGVVNIIYNETLYWIRKVGFLGWKPVFLRRVFMDEEVSSSGKFPKLMITPNLSLLDWLRIFDTPTAERIDHLAGKGEQGVWPYINIIKVRCVIEQDLDKAFSQVEPWL